MFLTALLATVAMVRGDQDARPLQAIERDFYSSIIKLTPGTDEYPATPSDDMTLPEMITKVEPIYPAQAKKVRWEGKVVLEAVVKTDGTIGDVKVLSFTNELFNEAAITAVKQWTYKPALNKDGKPVAIYYVIRVDFRVKQSAPTLGS